MGLCRAEDGNGGGEDGKVQVGELGHIPDSAVDDQAEQPARLGGDSEQLTPVSVDSPL
jgi:hypothetical protein